MTIAKHTWFKLGCIALFSMAFFIMAILVNAEETAVTSAKKTLLTI